MLINDEIQKQLLQLFAKSSNIPKVEAEQQSAAQLQLAPGQQVQAEVMARLPNHLYLARIAGELFKMELPLNVQPGETMQMTFVGAEPHFTFELVKPESGFLPVNISTTGKWLSALMAQQDGPEIRNLPNSTATVLDGVPGDTEHLAGRLKEVLSQGGLFYESHLAEWAAGERSLKQLLLEPQGKLSRRLMHPDQGVQHSVEGESPILSELISAETTGATSSTGVAADPQTFPLIRDQLATLNSGMVSWSGQIWQEQQASITIEEGDSGSAAVEDREWQSSVRLHLPKLGMIDATLRLRGSALGIVLKAEESDTTAILNGEIPALKERLDQAGIRLTDAVIAHEQGRE